MIFKKKKETLMKKQFGLCIGLTLFCGLNISTLYAQTNLFSEDPALNATFNSSWLDHTQFQTTRNQASAQDITSLLISIGVLDLLQANIYKRTNPINVRNLLDYPTYMPIKYSSSTWTTNAIIFYNHT